MYGLYILKYLISNHHHHRRHRHANAIFPKHNRNAEKRRVCAYQFILIYSTIRNQFFAADKTDKRNQIDFEWEWKWKMADDLHRQDSVFVAKSKKEASDITSILPQPKEWPHIQHRTVYTLYSGAVATGPFWRTRNSHGAQQQNTFYHASCIK